MYNQSKWITAIVAAVMAFTLAAALQAQEGAGAPGQRAVLVELFTSEGCSSCPPADALLKLVNGSRTNAGTLVVGISEHVTYWNELGWSDPYSSPVYTDRQNAYGQRFQLDGVYTPQMVINGAEQIVGTDRTALAQAVQKEEEQRPRMSLRILSLSVAGDRLTVKYSAGGDVPAKGVDVIAVLADDSDKSNVLHGENSGRLLAHVAVARSISRVGKVQAAGERTVQIQIPSSFQASQGHHLILFAQTPGNGPVLGTDTKPL
jgi:hypothetical protein